MQRVKQSCVTFNHKQMFIVLGSGSDTVNHRQLLVTWTCFRFSWCLY